MAKATASVKAKVKKKPVKAGSTPRPHGGIPTDKIVEIRAKIIADIKKRNDGKGTR